MLRCNISCAFCRQLEVQRVIRATLERPPATDAELEMLDILTRGGVFQLDSLCVGCVFLVPGLFV